MMTKEELILLVSVWMIDKPATSERQNESSKKLNTKKEN